MLQKAAQCTWLCLRYLVMGILSCCYYTYNKETTRLFKTKAASYPQYLGGGTPISLQKVSMSQTRFAWYLCHLAEGGGFPCNPPPQKKKKNLQNAHLQLWTDRLIVLIRPVFTLLEFVWHLCWHQLAKSGHRPNQVHSVLLPPGRGWSIPL